MDDLGVPLFSETPITHIVFFPQVLFVFRPAGLCSGRGRWIDVSRIQGLPAIGVETRRKEWWNWMKLLDSCGFNSKNCREYIRIYPKNTIRCASLSCGISRNFPLWNCFCNKSMWTLHSSRKVARLGRRVEQYKLIDLDRLLLVTCEIDGPSSYLPSTRTCTFPEKVSTEFHTHIQLVSSWKTRRLELSRTRSMTSSSACLLMCRFV